MKKILFLGRFPPPIHGAAKMNEQYFNSKLLNKNFQMKRIKINCSNNLEDMGKFTLQKLMGFIIVFFKLLFQLVFFRPNLIYFEIAPNGIAFYRDSIYILLCKIFRRRLLFCFQAKGVSTSIDKKISKLYYKFIFKNTKAIILSNLLYYDIRDVIRKENTYILPNNIEDEISENNFNKIIRKRGKNKKLMLLFLSNMIESKGPLDVLKICKELDKKNINFECLFVGKFQDKNFKNKFQNKIKEFNLGKKCKYLGAKYGKEKIKILEKTNYLIFPTKYPFETFGIVIIEAFMFGIPVLSYNNASISEIISSSKLGIVSHKNKWKELERELERRINKKEDAVLIKKYFNKNYTLKIAEKKLQDIFNKELSS